MLYQCIFNIALEFVKGLNTKMNINKIGKWFPGGARKVNEVTGNGEKNRRDGSGFLRQIGLLFDVIVLKLTVM